MNPESFVAARVAAMSTSGIRRVFDLAATLEDPIDFSMGQPDFAVPQPAKEAAAAAIHDDRNGYTVTHGIAPLRDALRAEVADLLTDDHDVLVTAGVSGGLSLIMTVLLDPGDEVILPDPYFVSYPHLVHLATGVSRPVDTAPDFVLTAERAEAAITPRTKAILVNSPSNPTGVVYPASVIQDLCDVAERHDLLLISDEIYSALSFDELPVSPAQFAPHRTVMLRGFGKTYGMTGWRLGYATAPRALIAEMAKIQQYTFVCAPHPFQYAAMAALQCDMSVTRRDYTAKRDLVTRLLDGAFEFARPGGGFFVYCKAPAAFASGTAFVEAAIKQNVLTVPGAAFSQHDTHFRISYAVPNDKLEAGCAILCELTRS